MEAPGCLGSSTTPETFAHLPCALQTSPLPQSGTRGTSNYREFARPSHRLWFGLCAVLFLLACSSSCHAQPSFTTSRPTVAPTPTSSGGAIGVPSPTTPPLLYPGILDLGPPDPNGLEFGIIMPLNLSTWDDSYWQSVVISCISAIRLAVQDVNQAGILPLNITLSMRSSQPPPGSIGQDGSAAMMSSAQFISHNVSALIGDTVSWLTAYSASMTSALRIPQCSFSSISDDLSSKILYGYFFRTTPTGKVISDVFLQYIQAMGWRRIGIVYTSDAFGLSLANEIAHRASSYGIQVVYWEVVYLPNANATAFERTMENLRNLGSYVNLVLTTDTDLLRALEDIENAGMFQLPYLWITLNNVARDVTTYFSVPGRPSPTHFNGLVMLDLYYDLKGDPEYDKFYDRWLRLDPKLYPGAGPGTELNYYQGRAYSCVQMLALGYQKDIERAKQRGLNDSFILEQLRAGTYPRTVGNLSASHFAEIEYDGPAGKMVLNRNGDPQSGSWVFYQLQNNRAVVVGRSDPINSTAFKTTIVPGAHLWPGYSSNGDVSPPDGPSWVLQNLRWKEPIAQAFGTLAHIGMLASVIVMGIVVWKRKDPVIKASSPYFCVLEILGILLVYLVVPMRTGTAGVASCAAVPLVIVLGSTLLLGSLIVKNLRIYRIFSNVFYNKYSIKNSVLARQVSVILLVCMSAPVLYVVITQPKPTYTSISPTKTAILCQPSNHSLDTHAQTIFMILMVLPNLVLLAVAGYLAYSTQHVAANWNEAKAMAYTIYNILFAALICIPTMFFPHDLYRVSVFIQNSLIIFAASVSLIALFGPKLLVMRRRALRARGNNSKSGSSSSSTGYHRSSLSQSHSQSGGGGSHSGGSHGRKEADFCRSRGSKEFTSSSACPHTASGVRLPPLPSHASQVVVAAQDEHGLVAAGPSSSSGFGLQPRFGGARDEHGVGGNNAFSAPPAQVGVRREKSLSMASPFTSSHSRTDYFQHPRATLAAAQEPVDPLAAGTQFVQLTPFHPGAWRMGGGGGGGGGGDGGGGGGRGGGEEGPQFDAIHFRTGVLGHSHSASNHPHNQGFDLHLAEEEDMESGGVGGSRPSPIVSMMIGRQQQAGTGTIPVLVQNTRHWISRTVSRWRAMRVIVVSSLGMVMLIDPKKVKTETFLYTEVTALTERRHFFLRVSCEQGYELQLEYPCAQARDLWLRSFTTMGTIHDSNQLNPLRHRHQVTGSSNASNNSSSEAIHQQQQQQQVEPLSTGSATAPSTVGSSTPTPTLLASVMELTELGRTREHRDSNGSETPFALSTLQEVQQQRGMHPVDDQSSPDLSPVEAREHGY